jgi:hypothetical protein
MAPGSFFLKKKKAKTDPNTKIAVLTMLMAPISSIYSFCNMTIAKAMAWLNETMHPIGKREKFGSDRVPRSGGMRSGGSRAFLDRCPKRKRGGMLRQKICAKKVTVAYPADSIRIDCKITKRRARRMMVMTEIPKKVRGTFRFISTCRHVAVKGNAMRYPIPTISDLYPVYPVFSMNLDTFP